MLAVIFALQVKDTLGYDVGGLLADQVNPLQKLVIIMQENRSFDMGLQADSGLKDQFLEFVGMLIMPVSLKRLGLVDQAEIRIPIELSRDEFLNLVITNRKI